MIAALKSSLFTRYDIDSLDNRDPERVVRFIETLAPILKRYFRPTIDGVERIPEGPGLYVGNHNAALLSPDTFIFAIAAYEKHGLDAVPYGLGHEIAIQLPFIHQLVVPLGAVRASHELAHRLFAEGRKVLVYPGGDLDAMRSYWDRNRIVFGPRRGYIRLALREAVPIIPVVTAGAHSTLVVLSDGRWLARALGVNRLFRAKVWPIALSLPWGLTVGPVPPHFPLPARIQIRVLEPMRFEREGPDAAKDADYVEACHTRVLSTMQAALDEMARSR